MKRSERTPKQGSYYSTFSSNLTCITLNNFIFSYPAVYIFCVLSNSIARWLSFTGHNPPHKFILFANTIYALSGFFNFLVFYLTRKAMVIGEQIRDRDDEERRSNPEGFLPPDHPHQQDGDIPLSPVNRNRLGTSPVRQETEERGYGFLPR